MEEKHIFWKATVACWHETRGVMEWERLSRTSFFTTERLSRTSFFTTVPLHETSPHLESSLSRTSCEKRHQKYSLPHFYQLIATNT